MKKSLLVLLSFALLAGSAVAGPRFGVYVNLGGGCGPRYYAPPVCYAPRAVYYAPAVTYSYAAPVYYTSAPVVYAPAYRAPIVTGGVAVSPVAFGWRR